MRRHYLLHDLYYARASGDVPTTRRLESEQRQWERDNTPLLRLERAIRTLRDLEDEIVEVDSERVDLQRTIRALNGCARRLRAARNRRILAERISGQTMEQIGDRYNLTRERVGQILKRIRAGGRS